MGISERLLFPDPSQSFLETGQPRERINLIFPMRGLAYGLNGGFYYARVTANF